MTSIEHRHPTEAATHASTRDSDTTPIIVEDEASRRLGPVRKRRRIIDAPLPIVSVEPDRLTNRPVEGPEVKVDYCAIEQLKVPKRQLREHKPKQVEQIMSSIRRMGFINPIVVDAEMRIVCGIGRYLAASEIGLTRVPVIVVDHLSEAELRAYAIADNKLVLNDTWDEKLLAIELSELMVTDIDLPIELTAFNLIEIDNLLFVEQESDSGPLEPDESEPVSQLGDLYDLGGHRLLCGDSRNEETYQTLLGDERARCVVSDNPYNIKISGNVSGLGRVKHGEFVMGSGEMSKQEFTDFLTSVFVLLARYSVDGAIHFQFMDHRHLREMLDAGEAAYHELKTLVVWDKQVAGMGSFYRNQFELVFVYKVGTAPHRNNFGLGEWGRHRSSVWSYPGANAMRRGRLDTLALHPTVKNLEMVMDAIRDVTHRGEIVLDPFSGASTTLLACERTGRIARCIELDPKYVDVGIRRWEGATGKQAVHIASGLTFQELAMSRSGADARGTEPGIPDESEEASAIQDRED
jgi:DNA modification methylase